MFVYLSFCEQTHNKANLKIDTMADTDNNPNGDHTSSRSHSNNNRGTGSANDSSNEPPHPRRGIDAVIEHITNHRIDFILAVTRALTVLCTFSYIIGFPGSPSNRYKQALLVTAATSSLRLHQRMPPPPFNQLGSEYFSNLIREDSFHYLMFPILFFFDQPISLTLLPCALYALFNLAVYAISILDKIGNQERLKLQISSLVAKYQQSLLHTIALSEVAIMPIVFIGVFTRVVGFLVPILYYRFLLLRYKSTRNAHLRLLVSQIYTIGRSYASRYLSR